MIIKTEQYQRIDADVFWSEIAPCNHLVQIYDTEKILLGSLESFVISGLAGDESVVIIATADHISSLNKRLRRAGYRINSLLASGRYIPVNAEEALSVFMRNSMPDEALFTDMAKKLILRARGENYRKIRAFGEMVALLWAQGNTTATAELEQFWNRFCETEVFSLFCAYPKASFGKDHDIHNICCAHSKVIAGDLHSVNEVAYMNVALKKPV